MGEDGREQRLHRSRYDFSGDAPNGSRREQAEACTSAQRKRDSPCLWHWRTCWSIAPRPIKETPEKKVIGTAVLQAYTGSTDTATLTFLEKGTIAWLQQWIPRYLGESASLVDVLSGPPRQADRLSMSPNQERLRRRVLSEVIDLAKITAVEERTSPTANWIDLGTLATDYEILREVSYSAAGRTLRRLTAAFPFGNQNLRVSFTHGYAEDAGPDDVTEVALQMIKAQLGAKDQGSFVEEELAGQTGGRLRLRYGNLGALAGVNSSKLAALRFPTY